MQTRNGGDLVIGKQRCLAARHVGHALIDECRINRAGVLRVEQHQARLQRQRFVEAARRGKFDAAVARFLAASNAARNPARCRNVVGVRLVDTERSGG